MLPSCKKIQHMSWMFGPHMEENAIYFGGDDIIVRQNPKEIPMEMSDPPAWLIADWIREKSRGRPVSNVAQYYLEHKQYWNKGLHWLEEFLKKN